MIALSLTLALLAQDPAAAPAAADAGTPHVQTAAEWVEACKDDLDRCQSEIGRSVTNRARMSGEFGCAELTDAKIYEATVKWLAKHKDVAALPAKEGLVKATEAIWPCIKPKFPGRIP